MKISFGHAQALIDQVKNMNVLRYYQPTKSHHHEFSI